MLSAVPLALLGPVIALTSLGVANNLYTQIGLILMIALSAKNGILIVEMAREGRLVHGMPILEAAVEASRSRFRPILMTSFAFGMGVLPLVLASGRRRQRGYLAGTERAQRHHRLDLPRGAVRPVFLRGAAALRRGAQSTQKAAGDSPRRVAVLGVRRSLSRQPPQDLDQLLVRGTCRVAEFIGRVGVR